MDNNFQPSVIKIILILLGILMTSIILIIAGMILEDKAYISVSGAILFFTSSALIVAYLRSIVRIHNNI